MIVYAPGKINLGLHITGKREDGYHDIETLMIPIPMYDIIEIIKSEEFSFRCTGNIRIDGSSNLCEKAYQLMRDEFNISPIYMHLRKQIPVGAGLGGGSSDASNVLIALNELFELNLDKNQLRNLSARLGSDCPFFIDTDAQFAKGRGERLNPFPIDLSNNDILIVYPNIHISTKEAYNGIQSFSMKDELIHFLKESKSNWKRKIKNDFEVSVFQKHPILDSIKAEMYKSGAWYASLSGSGSAMFGLFPKNKVPKIKSFESFMSFTGNL